MDITTIGSLIAASGAGYAAWRMWGQNQELQQQLKQKDHDLRSAYVRFGKTFEQYAPFTESFTQEERDNFVFLGCPIDGVTFTEEAVKLVEIKTGNAQLSPKQKRIKKQVEEGKVEFKEVRY